MKRNAAIGFTLIELMIVVAIIALIAAIAIPSMLRSRMAANETSAIASIKTYSQSQEIYHRVDWDKDGTLEYSQSLGNPAYAVVTYPNLIDRVSPYDGIVGIIDRSLSNAEGDPGAIVSVTPKAGYVFVVLLTHGPTAASYLVADPSGGGMSMINGHALSCVPESYDTTGRNRYILDQTGVIYQRDAGIQQGQETNYYADQTQGWVVAQ